MATTTSDSVRSIIEAVATVAAPLLLADVQPQATAVKSLHDQSKDELKATLPYSLAVMSDSWEHGKIMAVDKSAIHKESGADGLVVKATSDGKTYHKHKWDEWLNAVEKISLGVLGDAPGVSGGLSVGSFPARLELVAADAGLSKLSLSVNGDSPQDFPLEEALKKVRATWRATDGSLMDAGAAQESPDGVTVPAATLVGTDGMQYSRRGNLQSIGVLDATSDGSTNAGALAKFVAGLCAQPAAAQTIARGLMAACKAAPAAEASGAPVTGRSAALEVLTKLQALADALTTAHMQGVSSELAQLRGEGLTPGPGAIAGALRTVATRVPAAPAPAPAPAASPAAAAVPDDAQLNGMSADALRELLRAQKRAVEGGAEGDRSRQRHEGPPAPAPAPAPPATTFAELRPSGQQTLGDKELVERLAAAAGGSGCSGFVEGLASLRGRKQSFGGFGAADSAPALKAAADDWAVLVQRLRDARLLTFPDRQPESFADAASRLYELEAAVQKLGAAPAQPPAAQPQFGFGQGAAGLPRSIRDMPMGSYSTVSQAKADDTLAASTVVLRPLTEMATFAKELAQPPAASPVEAVKRATQATGYGDAAWAFLFSGGLSQGALPGTGAIPSTLTSVKQAFEAHVLAAAERAMGPTAAAPIRAELRKRVNKLIAGHVTVAEVVSDFGGTQPTVQESEDGLEVTVISEGERGTLQGARAKSCLNDGMAEMGKLLQLAHGEAGGMPTVAGEHDFGFGAYAKQVTGSLSVEASVKLFSDLLRDGAERFEQARTVEGAVRPDWRRAIRHSRSTALVKAIAKRDAQAAAREVQSGDGAGAAPAAPAATGALECGGGDAKSPSKRQQQREAAATRKQQQQQKKQATEAAKGQQAASAAAQQAAARQAAAVQQQAAAQVAAAQQAAAAASLAEQQAAQQAAQQNAQQNASSAALVLATAGFPAPARGGKGATGGGGFSFEPNSITRVVGEAGSRDGAIEAFEHLCATLQPQVPATQRCCPWKVLTGACKRASCQQCQFAASKPPGNPAPAGAVERVKAACNPRVLGKLAA